MSIVSKLLTDFSNGLNNAQLIGEINLSNIAANCTNVSTDDADVDIHFDGTLDSFELITLDDKITAHVAVADVIVVAADIFHIDNIEMCYEVVAKSQFTLTKNVRTTIGGWTLSSGSMDGMALTSGLWTCPADGLYMHNLVLTGVGAHTNDKIHIEVTDTNDVFKFGQSNIISSTNQHAFAGNGGIWTAGDTLKIKLECDTSNMDLTLLFKVIMMMAV